MEGYVHFWGFLKFEFNQATRWAHEADTRKYLKIPFLKFQNSILPEHFSPTDSSHYDWANS